MEKTEFKTVRGERIIVECPPGMEEEVDLEIISDHGADYDHLTTGQLMYLINLGEDDWEHHDHIDVNVSYAIMPDGETVVVIKHFDYSPKGGASCPWYGTDYEPDECEEVEIDGDICLLHVDDDSYLSVISGTGDDGKTYYRWYAHSTNILFVSNWFMHIESAIRDMHANCVCPAVMTDHMLIVD